MYLRARNWQQKLRKTDFRPFSGLKLTKTAHAIGKSDIFLENLVFHFENSGRAQLMSTRCVYVFESEL